MSEQNNQPDLFSGGEEPQESPRQAEKPKTVNDLKFERSYIPPAASYLDPPKSRSSSRPPKAPRQESGNSGGGSGGRRVLNIIFGLVILVLLGAVVYLMFTMKEQQKEADEMKLTLEMQKERLTGELNELYASYDSLHTQNDSLNSLVEQEKQRITDLLKIKASNARKIQIYESEVTSLRQVLKSYIVQVDSLNQANLRLQAENREVQTRIREATSINRQLEQQNKNLTQQVDQASVLKAIAVIAEPIDNSGAVQKRIRRAEKIRVCFSLAENNLAKPGPRRIYCRIASPDERVMVKSPQDTFEYQGNRIPYSAMREVEYEGAALEVCIFYEAGPGEIIEGTYYVDLYLNGQQIGTTSFSLR